MLVWRIMIEALLQNRQLDLTQNSKSKIQNYFVTPLLTIISIALALLLNNSTVDAAMLSSANIPLDSPIYSYLDKLAGFGLINSDIKGIKPFSKAEAARLILEAENKLKQGDTDSNLFALELIRNLREIIPREISLRKIRTRNRNSLITTR